jgi:hypothetical protein
MITPNQKTPVERCQELGLYTEHMLGKFPDNPRLAALVPRMHAGNGALEAAELAYRSELRALTRLRIDVDFENYVSDRRVRRTRKAVEMHDGRRGGRIAAQVVPDGSLDFSRIQGAKQIEAMRSLEVRLLAARDIWPEAVSEMAEIAQHRMRYAAASAARDEGLRRVKDLRLQRNAAKERFLHLYAEIVSLVAAEFPRDRATQELFFLNAYEKSGRASEDGEDSEDIEDGEPGADLPGEPGDEPAAAR